MKSKGCLTTILVILALVVGVSFLLPKDMNVVHSDTLEASPEQLFYQINNVKNWKDWSPWFEMDKDMKVEYSAKSSGEGAFYSWESEKKFVGNGKMLIDESIHNEKVGTTLTFEDYNGGNADISFKPNGAQTDVEWAFTSDYKAKIWSRYYNAFSRFMLKNSFKKGLKNLEAHIKANPEAHVFKSPYPKIKIEESKIEGFNAVTSVVEGKWSEFGSPTYAQGFGQAMGQVMEEQLEVSGYPFSRWMEWDTTSDYYKIELGVPVSSGGKSFETVNAIKAIYYGNYPEMDAAYMALEAYCNHHGINTGMPYEIFVTDPTLEPDTSKWLTEIYYPIE